MFRFRERADLRDHLRHNRDTLDRVQHRRQDASTEHERAKSAQDRWLIHHGKDAERFLEIDHELNQRIRFLRSDLERWLADQRRPI